MHNLTKIKIFRVALWITYPVALLLLYPIVLLKKKKAPLFFFFDRYSMGGAQVTYLDILKSVEGQEKQVYFTRKSLNDAFRQRLYAVANSRCTDIHFWCDNILFRLFSVHFFAFYVNRHKNAQVLSSNSTFFFDMLPFFRRSIKATELLHNFTYGKNGFEFFGLANCRYLAWRLVVDMYTLSNIKKQYAEYGIPDRYKDRVRMIEPGVDIPSAPPAKDFSLPLKILYAGRESAQKRVWLIDAIAAYAINNRLPVTFLFAGSDFSALSELTKKHAVLHGIVTDRTKMEQIYSESHIVILTSAFEGFPMVIKEGMAHGCVPLVTALEGNKTHLVQGKNALLIDAIEDEEQVVQLAIQHIDKLLADPALLPDLSRGAFEYARTHFGKDRFISAYQDLFAGRGVFAPGFSEKNK